LQSVRLCGRTHRVVLSQPLFLLFVTITDFKAR
jgi:hypothetical protein